MRRTLVFGVFTLLAAVAIVAGCKKGEGRVGTQDVSSAGKLLAVQSSSYTISMKGGKGSTGAGGNGGYLYVDCYGIEGISVGLPGTIDTRFVIPKAPPIKLGERPLVVSSNLTIDCYIDQATAQAAVADGNYYILYNNNILYLRDSAGGDSSVTGIHILPGRTLTLGLNFNWGGNDGCDDSGVSFPYDILIEGTLTVKDLANGGNPIGGSLTPDTRHGEATANPIDKGGLEIYCRTLLITTSGKIDLSGTDATTADTRGGDGGFVWLYTNGAFIHGPIDCTGGNGLGTGIGGFGCAYPGGGTSGIYVWSGGFAVNTATLDASGGNGSSGGEAGYTEIDANVFVCNTGTLKSNGGNGTDNDGGDGNEIYLYSEYASVMNSGKLESNGGSSVDGSGGDGSNIYIYASNSGYIGQILNSGAIEAKGGYSENEDGGEGGYIYFENHGADIVNTGSIDMRGGNAPLGYAGDGGYMEIYAYEGYDEGYGEYVQPGSVIISGNINLNGGDGDLEGGDAGYIEIYSTDYALDHYENTYGVHLFGYGAISCAGGKGASGGDGGHVEMYTYNFVATDDDYQAPGPIVVDADLDFSGGVGTAGPGGNGGYYELYTYDNENYFNETSTITHRGDVNVSGGNGDTYGGDAGHVYIYGWALVSFTGNVNGKGGNGTGTDSDGGDGIDDFELYSSFDVRFIGSLNGCGGTATGAGTGGYGGEAYLYAGGQVYSRASYDCSGGDADLTTGSGGDGGYVDLFSETFPTDHVGQVDVSGGKGSSDGLDGEFYLDWSYYTP